jgi:putative nucleotidyltransferase with HDIG domain
MSAYPQPVQAATATGEASEPRPLALQKLPRFPGVALQLLNLLDNPETKTSEIEQVLRMDPALSAEILRVSNSAFYGFRRTVDSVARAAVLLGMKELRRLALTASFGGFFSQFKNNDGLRVCWRHSVACALISEELARMLGQQKDRAYTAGLLHDLGRLALLACYPERWRDMLEVAQEHGLVELEAERGLFDLDHCEAGAQLGREWNLPDELVEVIANHHKTPIRDASLGAIVAAGDQLANLLGYSVIKKKEGPEPLDLIQGLPLANHREAADHILSLTEKIETGLSAFVWAKN